MNIEHIIEFVMLAELCDYQEAADHLFIAQSTLSRHIQSLENEIGEPLFTRSSRKVTLNENGKFFLHYAEPIAAAYQDYTRARSIRRSSVRQRLIIGSVPMLSHYGILRVLSDFRRMSGALRMEIIEGDSGKLISMVEHGYCDMAFVLTPKDWNAPLPYVTYYSDVLAAILPLSHKFAREKSISLKMLENEQFSFLPDSTIRQICIAACRDAGFKPNESSENNPARYVFSNVQSGIGCTLAPKRYAEKMGRVAIVELNAPVSIYLNVVYRKSSMSIDLFKKLLQRIQQGPVSLDGTLS